MNKIFYLKILVGVMTFLIFLTLGGIIYGIVNYRTTPKLFSGKKRILSSSKESPLEFDLNLSEQEHIQDSHACANMLCVRIVSDFDSERIIIFDPVELKIKAVLSAKTKKAQQSLEDKKN